MVSHYSCFRAANNYIFTSRNFDKDMTEEQAKKMSELCYNLTHQISTLSTEDLNYIQYNLHAYVEHVKNWTPKPYARERTTTE